MPKDPWSRPNGWKEIGGNCPECQQKRKISAPTVARRSQRTRELYFGCSNFQRGCRFYGCRSH